MVLRQMDATERHYTESRFEIYIRDGQIHLRHSEHIVIKASHAIQTRHAILCRITESHRRRLFRNHLLMNDTEHGTSGCLADSLHVQPIIALSVKKQRDSGWTEFQDNKIIYMVNHNQRRYD